MSGAGARVRCWIYRGGARGDAYVYLARKDDFECLPADLRRALGRLEPAMELELHAGRRLARAAVTEVMSALASSGYYLQLPPMDTPSGPRLQ